jgi:PIN domain nuclease of toxin-antitoxin system
MGRAQVIVVDTHVLLWWFSSETAKLSASSLAALENERNGGKIFVSSITAWEIAILVERGRICLGRDVLSWLAAVSLVDAVRFVPIDNEIAVLSTQLGPEFHRDPADRYIVATCLKLSAPLVTADRQIHRYPHVRTIW